MRPPRGGLAARPRSRRAPSLSARARRESSSPASDDRSRAAARRSRTPSSRAPRPSAAAPPGRARPSRSPPSRSARARRSRNRAASRRALTGCRRERVRAPRGARATGEGEAPSTAGPPESRRPAAGGRPAGTGARPDPAGESRPGDRRPPERTIRRVSRPAPPPPESAPGTRRARRTPRRSAGGPSVQRAACPSSRNTPAPSPPPARPRQRSWSLPREIARHGLAAEPRRLRDAERGRVERELERDAVDEPEDHRGGAQDVHAAKGPRPDALGDDGADEPPHPLVERGVDLAKPPAVHHLAPELDEHDPEGALLDRQPQARRHQCLEPRLRVLAAPGLRRRHPPVQIGRHRLERGHEDRALVGEVVVQDPLAHPGLTRDLFHGEPRVPIARQTPDRRPDDRSPPKRRHAPLGAHPPSSLTYSFFLDWPTNYLCGELARQANVFEVFRAGSASRGPREAQMRGRQRSRWASIGPRRTPGAEPPRARLPVAPDRRSNDRRTSSRRRWPDGARR